jgi:hypothetical protein
MVSPAVENAESFFTGIATSKMSAQERTLYELKLERASLLRRANEYSRDLNRIEQYAIECTNRLEARHHGADLHGRKYRDRIERQAAAHRSEMARLNAEFPLGAARDELRAINVEIAAAVTALQRSWLEDRKPGERFSTFQDQQRRRVKEGI